MLSKYNRYMLSCLIGAMGILFVIHNSSAETEKPAAMDHSMHMAAPMAMTAPGKPDDIYAPAMDKMMKSMQDAKVTGDADVDFAAQMIAHHQAAIDMAEILLQKGNDPEMKKLGQDVIAAQTKEIAFMQEWLKKNAEKK